MVVWRRCQASLRQTGGASGNGPARVTCRETVGEGRAADREIRELLACGTGVRARLVALVPHHATLAVMGMRQLVIARAVHVLPRQAEAGSLGVAAEEADRAARDSTSAASRSMTLAHRSPASPCGTRSARS